MPRAYRGGYKLAIRDPLPKQMLPYLVLHCTTTSIAASVTDKGERAVVPGLGAEPPAGAQRRLIGYPAHQRHRDGHGAGECGRPIRDLPDCKHQYRCAG